MKAIPWKPALAAWGIVAIVYCVAIWPPHVDRGPFQGDEAMLARSVGAMVKAATFFLFPPIMLWAITGWLTRRD